jgi:hypothetical protein
VISRREARAARGDVEAALDAVASSSGWPWKPQLSRWIDVLVTIEEAAAAS